MRMQELRRISEGLEITRRDLKAKAEKAEAAGEVAVGQALRDASTLVSTTVDLIAARNREIAEEVR